MTKVFVSSVVGGWGTGKLLAAINVDLAAVGRLNAITEFFLQRLWDIPELKTNTQIHHMLHESGSFTTQSESVSPGHLRQHLRFHPSKTTWAERDLSLRKVAEQVGEV